MHDETLVEDLRTTSAQVSATAGRLEELEATKRALDPGDARMRELSNEVERLAAELRRQAAIEGDLTREIRASVAQEATAE